MREVAYIDLKAAILSDNDSLAQEIRERLQKNGTLMLNLMASPGAGKTVFIQRTLQMLAGRHSIAVVEGDIESRIDADKIAAMDIPTVQLRTGGSCHLDAAMINEALMAMESLPELIIIENVGNLVCPAEFDVGAGLSVTILSVPEGDDKPVKYPLMYTVCDALIVSKCDTLPMFDFDFELACRRARKLNPALDVFTLSAKTGEGMDAWIDYLENTMAEAKKGVR